MENPIKQIYKFNQEAGLLDKGYNDRLESSFLIEEALEGFDLSVLSKDHDLPDTAKELSRALVQAAIIDDITDVERLDKACDQVVFAVGAMAKLGLGPNNITRALNIVMKANNAKIKCPKDSMGKLMKPDDFDEKYAPEPQLQALLDSPNKGN